MTSEIEVLADLLRAAQSDFRAALAGITERELHTPPSPEGWTVAHIVGHVAEIQVFFIRRSQLMATLENPDIARSPDEQESRAGAAESQKTTPWPDLDRHLKDAERQALERLSRLREQDLRRLGKRGAAETVTVQQLIERSVVDHMREHAGEVRRIRAALAERPS